jgi:DNA repair protein SbcD/Mre11
MRRRESSGRFSAGFKFELIHGHITHMKIAITADVHLKAGAAHPERVSALENVFEQTTAASIDALIIAGDLFDEDFQNYSEFEGICRSHPSVQVHVIPGNHDANISQRSITGANVHIYTEPEVVEFDSLAVLFAPYKAKAKMVEAIAQVEAEIRGRPWVLVGHGDFYGGVREPNPLEPGTYMPISRGELERFGPRTSFLGHIHIPHCPAPNVHYVGSPCGLDISETGRRRFVVYDTEDGQVEERLIRNEILYFSERFLVLPREDEVLRLEREISERIESWNLQASDYSKMRVRVEAVGYAQDRSAILDALKRGFDNFTYFKDQEPTIEQLSESLDDQLGAMAQRAVERIRALEWPFGGDEPSREQVEVAALSVIYQAK